MILVIVEFSVTPENVSDTVAALEIDAAAARAMKGCVAFRSLSTQGSPDKLVLVEEWEDVESFEVYKASDAFAAAMATIKPVMVGAPVSRAFEATLA